MAKATTTPETDTDAAAKKAAQTAAALAADRIAPVLTAVTDAVPLPQSKRTTGLKNRSAYADQFEALTTVGQSFGVQNKTKKQLQGVVAKFNRGGYRPKVDAAGQPVFKMQDMTNGATGETVKIATSEQETEQFMHFVVHNVDPATDPDGASARVWRDL